MSSHRLKRTATAMALVLFVAASALVAPATAFAGSSCGITIAPLDSSIPSASKQRKEALPICFSPSGSMLKLFFIGNKGVHQGPEIPGIEALDEIYPGGSGNMVVYTGVNPMSGAPVIITYLSDDRLLHVHTGLWDRYWERFDPFLFVVDGQHKAMQWKIDYVPALGPSAGPMTGGPVDPKMYGPEEPMMASSKESMMASAEEPMMASVKEPMMAGPHPPRGSIDMVSLYPATTVEVDAVGIDLAFYFITGSGVIEGPRLPSATMLSREYPKGSGNIVLYTGTNSLKGASRPADVIISYLSDDKLVHVHTAVWDKYWKTFKSYIFVIDGKDTVSIWELGEVEEVN